MKIAVITSGILPVPAVQGGAVENLIDFYLEYNEQHKLHDITIYSAYHKNVKQHFALQSSVNHYVYINVKSLWFRFKAKLYWKTGHYYYYHHCLDYFIECIYQKIRHSNYDLIILENRPGFALRLSKKISTPIYAHIHTNLLYEPTAINQEIISRTSRFIVVSNYIKNEIKKVGVDSDIRIVYNGLDVSLFPKIGYGTISRKDIGFKNSDFIAAFWGRLVPQKGIKELLLAMELLKEENDIKLMVIGSTNYEDTHNQTNSFIEELKLIAERVQGKIVFTGYVPYSKIAQYLALANVAVVPSMINEALGMTCIEACALGLPIVATNDGGIPETLVGQKHILLDKDNNLPLQLKNAILQVKTEYASYQGNHLNPLFKKENYCRSFFDNLE